jgi:hypothetical protein
VLINNAGVLKARNTKTPDGLDLRFVVNTLAPSHRAAVADHPQERPGGERVIRRPAAYFDNEAGSSRRPTSPRSTQRTPRR